jgi:hypothetical protein
MHIPFFGGKSHAEWWSALTVVLVGTLVLTVVLLYAPSPAVNTLRERFNDRVREAADLQPLSPLVVTVYERAAPSRHNHFTTDLIGVGPRVLDLTYNERLIVVKPQNWMIYTNNGINFYLITNNVSNRTAQCDLDRQMIAIDFRLQTMDEPDDKRDETGRLKVACLNYTLDNLIRLFGVDANRTYVDLSAHFDKKQNSRAPTLVADEVVNYLLQHGLV